VRWGARQAAQPLLVKAPLLGQGQSLLQLARPVQARPFLAAPLAVRQGGRATGGTTTGEGTTGNATVHEIWGQSIWDGAPLWGQPWASPCTTMCGASLGLVWGEASLLGTVCLTGWPVWDQSTESSLGPVWGHYGASMGPVWGQSRASLGHRSGTNLGHRSGAPVWGLINDARPRMRRQLAVGPPGRPLFKLKGPLIKLAAHRSNSPLPRSLLGV
jgi:hypothetical protein